MKKQRGRKAVVVLSDGVDHGSTESLRGAIEAAQRADTIVYSILFKDEEHLGAGFGGYPGMGRHGGGPGRYPQEAYPDGKKILEQMSRETGGRRFYGPGEPPVPTHEPPSREKQRNPHTPHSPPRLTN